MIQCKWRSEPIVNERAMGLVIVSERGQPLRMTLDPFAQFDQQMLDVIEYNATGAVPHTPTHQDSLRRLIESHQVYASADYSDGFVTMRTLATQPFFWANNLEQVLTGKLPPADLESDESIFNRYAASLPESLQGAAEQARSLVVERRLQHRNKHGIEEFHDPLHTLLMMPGAGAHPGLAGNYLFGSLVQTGGTDEDLSGSGAINLHDRDDGAAFCEMDSVAAALEKVQDLMASAPFLLSELEALDFRLN
jgi:hypothetical protein